MTRAVGARIEARGRPTQFRSSLSDVGNELQNHVLVTGRLRLRVPLAGR